ncbi:MAG: AbrB/MazE/SpoVT family DNA-binding domain-containing protein [Nanoarchaeota archaeon]
MIELKSKLRRWGNSFGVVIPQRAVMEEDLKEGDEINVFLQEEKNDISQIFGALKCKKINAQKLKDDIRKEEQKNDRLLSRHLRNG